MSKWKQTYTDRLGACIDVDGELYSSNSNLAALALIDVHNADIEALEFERDELRRRLDAVVERLAPETTARSLGYHPAYELYEAVKAIAEGKG